MRNLRLLVGLFCCLFILTESFSQEAKSLKFLEKGNSYYNKHKDVKAQKYYEKAFQADSNNIKASLFYGIGLLETNEKWRALPFIKKAYHVDPNIYDQIDLYLGKAYFYNSEYSKAIFHLERAKSSIKNYSKEERKEINLRLEQCKHAIQLEEESLDFSIINLGPRINSSFSEYAPILNPEQEKILFSSTRTNKKNQKDYFADVYAAGYKESDSKAAYKIQNNFNTKYDDIILDISPEGNQILLHSYKNNGDIYISTFTDGQWSKPISISKNINDPNSFEGAACFSKDGNALYFTSDRRGGIGGLDIYVSEKQENGQWAKAYNLGPEINTKGNEDAPSISKDEKILFFSSDGHFGIGGYDVFYSLKNELIQEWNSPKNMGVAINTPDDDINFVVSTDGTFAYFSSSRYDSYGGQDLYKVTLNPFTSENGSLLASLLPKNERVLQNQPFVHEVKMASNTFKTEPTIKDKEVLRNIYFNIDEEGLTEESKKQLTVIAQYLAKNKHVKIEVVGHTDDTGSKEYNIYLSEKRAGSVVEYLVSSGVSYERLYIKAFGNSVPLATNDDEKEGRELNRRVELNVVPEVKFLDLNEDVMYTRTK